MSLALSESTRDIIRSLASKSPDQIDLTREDHADMVYDISNSLIGQVKDQTELEAAEAYLTEHELMGTLAMRLALMLAKSKLWVQTIEQPLSISVVFAVYKEHNRIRKHTEHPHGEDFLIKKVDQLRWLFEHTPNISWELIIVDDGCPEKSGEIAGKIIEDNQLQGKVRVLFLAEAIEQGLEPTRLLDDTSQSQKGGSIVYGMWDAVQKNTGHEQIVVYTDADLSTHLGQVGLLLKPILESGKKVAIGSRREPTSVVIKKAGRNNRGKLFIYLWKQMIPVLGDIIDTQCGFKAFHAEIIPAIIRDMIESKFAFDIELLIRSALIEDDTIARVPIAWIDSEAASTTTDLQPYLPMLKSIARMYSRYIAANPHSDEFASYIEGLSEEDFHVLLEEIPEAIVQREPAEFNEFKGVKASDLYSS